MADVGLRDLGSFVPGGRSKQEPIAPQPPPSALAIDPGSVIVTPPPTPRAIFGGDHASGADALGMDGTIAHLAELVSHRGTATPLCVGLLGGAGSGKSFALAKLVASAGELAAASANANGPFLSRIHSQTIDAAGLEGDPAAGLAARLHSGLRGPYPDLARELAMSARDPQVVLRDVNEKLDEARRRLDSERRALDDAGSRRARLTETVLYEAAGSHVDAYARANRVGIESRLVAFGITGDPIRNYKNLVQLVAGSGGKLGLTLRALWAFKGQTKLIVAAIVLAAIGFGLGIALDDQDTWLASLRSGPKAGVTIADWAEAHIGLIGTARTGAFALAALAILANLWRAFAFLQPIFKGARLLDGDLETRRRDLDGLYAHQTKRVDALDADVEQLTRESGEAERRAGGSGTSMKAAPSPFEAASGAAQAQTFFAVLARAMGDARGPVAPQRVVLALDHLDAVAPERARQLLDVAHRVAAPGLVLVAAVDTARLGRGLADGGDLERWIQVPVRLDVAAGERDYSGLVQAVLGHNAPAAAARKPDARSSALDEPVGADEASLLTALAGLAGRSPRAVKRFVNLYTLARLDGDHRGALALMLALALGGTPAEKASVGERLAGTDANAPFDLPQSSASDLTKASASDLTKASASDLTKTSGRLRAGLDAAVAHGRFTTGEAAKAARRAAIYAI